MTVTVCRDGGGQVDQDIEVLLLTGARDGQQALNGAFPVVAARAEAEFAPLHRASEGSFRDVVCGVDPPLHARM